MEFAEQEFKLNKSLEGGSTLRQHLESIWRQTGRKPKELQNLISLPQSCSLVWKYFSELHTTRTSNGFGLNAINFAEMKAYFDLHDIEPEPWEIELIRRLDTKYLISLQKENK